MPLPLYEYHLRVSTHLDLIEAGAWMCVRHAKALTVRPAFETLAESEMKECETTLRRSLIDVRRAQQVYQRKAVDQ